MLARALTILIGLGLGSCLVTALAYSGEAQDDVRMSACHRIPWQKATPELSEDEKSKILLEMDALQSKIAKKALGEPSDSVIRDQERIVLLACKLGDGPRVRDALARLRTLLVQRHGDEAAAFRASVGAILKMLNEPERLELATCLRRLDMLAAVWREERFATELRFWRAEFFWRTGLGLQYPEFRQEMERSFQVVSESGVVTEGIRVAASARRIGILVVRRRLEGAAAAVQSLQKEDLVRSNDRLLHACIVAGRAISKARVSLQTPEHAAGDE
jgi:hypothetical protein